MFRGRRVVVEDRATRGTEAGGPQAKRSGGVSEANVRDITIRPWNTKTAGPTDRLYMNIQAKDYSAGASIT